MVSQLSNLKEISPNHFFNVNILGRSQRQASGNWVPNLWSDSDCVLSSGTYRDTVGGFCCLGQNSHPRVWPSLNGGSILWRGHNPSSEAASSLWHKCLVTKGRNPQPSGDLWFNGIRTSQHYSEVIFTLNNLLSIVGMLLVIEIRVSVLFVSVFICFIFSLRRNSRACSPQFARVNAYRQALEDCKNGRWSLFPHWVVLVTCFG